MSGAIYKAGAGAILQQMRLDVYANNLANVNTAGFKADQPAFRFDVADAGQQPAALPEKLSPYALPLEYVTDFDTGPLHATGSPLDIALTGEGFLEVQSPDGIRYTRSGHLRINEDGVLSTTQGWPVMGQGGEVTINGGRIEISGNGEITVDGDVAGTLRVVAFDDPGQLQKTGDAMFTAPENGAGMRDANDYRITQGAIEGSNVNAIRTMTEIIDTLRLFETYQKAIRSADDATAKTVNDVGRIG
jgi:flagellar basal-body rod protein FlgF